jgi:hypothetical protein
MQILDIKTGWRLKLKESNKLLKFNYAIQFSAYLPIVIRVSNPANSKTYMKQIGTKITNTRIFTRLLPNFWTFLFLSMFKNTNKTIILPRNFFIRVHKQNQKHQRVFGFVNDFNCSKQISIFSMKIYFWKSSSVYRRLFAPFDWMCYGLRTAFLVYKWDFLCNISVSKTNKARSNANLRNAPFHWFR